MGNPAAMNGEERLDELVEQIDGHPTGGESTITEVLEGYATGGFSSSFIVTDGAELECVECGTVSPAERVPMSSLRRLEGMSDPADMMAVVAITCPVCGAKGTTILGFGPNSTEQDAEVLKELRDRRSDDEAPGNSAPGETTAD
jgi:hypothetical protein